METEVKLEEKKAYDVKLLLEKLKAEGLEVAEESAKILVKAVFEWLEESADLSENAYDDMAKVVYPKVKEMILDKAEDINKEDNE